MQNCILRMCCWPDFSAQEFTRALNWYATRERRFGHTGDQIKEATDA